MKCRFPNLVAVFLVIGQGAMPLVQAQPTNLMIGGFDYIRSGDASFPIGASFSQARTAILSNYPTTKFTNFTTLAASNLAGVNILIIGTPATITNEISPLTAEEQTALLDFVNGGGASILFTDNESFSPSANTANNSFLAPFGMGSAGTVGGPAYLGVPSPLQHVVTSGPFGVVTNYTQLAPGAITNLGPYATALVPNDAGTALAVIDPGLIVPGSGPVVFFSDISGFWDTDGFFPTNAALFLNSIEFCRDPTPRWRLKIDPSGTDVVLHWPTAATNMVLEATTNLDMGSVWTQVTNVPVVVDTEKFVTNPVVGTMFYRLRGASP